MDIAVRKLEKSITLSISQNDFEIELARVAGVHLVLLTALLLGEWRWLVSGFRPCAGAVGEVVCLTLDQAVCTREVFKQPLSKAVTSCNSGYSLKKILAKRMEKNRRIHSVYSACGAR